jgi:hypothetical protein
VSIDELPPEMRAAFEARRAAFERLHAFTRVSGNLISRGDPVELVVSNVSVESAEAIKDGIDNQCLSIWGRGGSWAQLADVWTFYPPKGPPSAPDYCGACGAALCPTSSALRWQSPGASAQKANGGLTGWEHQCNPGVPQAGHFPTDLANPHDHESPEGRAVEAERYRYWLECSARRAGATAAHERSVREKNRGHLFVPSGDAPPACRDCGIAAAAFDSIPESERWWCPSAAGLAAPLTFVDGGSLELTK